MSLELIIGPANAEKAGVALGAYRRHLAAGRDPILVVPTLADVDAYRRELAGARAGTDDPPSAVFGVRVLRFAWLLAEIAERVGLSAQPLGGLAQERVAAVAVARARPRVLGAAARTPGFARALLGLVAELEERRLDPPRVAAALRAWAAAEPERRAYAEDLSALYAAYRRELRRVRAVDVPLRDAAALDALRLDPAVWRGTPVVVYGFDDLTPLQRDAVQTLAGHAGAEVTLTLTYERGRAALAARAGTFKELRALAGAEVRELPAASAHYASPALHHLERTLFEGEDGLTLFDAAGVAAGDAVRVLEGGGERAEVELVAAEVAALLREGYAPEEIAVVWRTPEAVAPLVEEVFAAHGVPFALTRRLRARDTALGRGVLALLRCALLGGSADDLLTWLRTPGFLRNPRLADALEQAARVSGARTAADARGLWEHFPLDAIDRVAEAAQRGPGPLCARLAAEVTRLRDAPHRGAARVLDAAERVDAAAAGALQGALVELGRLARRDPALVPPAEELERVLADLPVVAGRQPAPGLVQVTRPTAIRARRVRALFLCGLNEHVFPRPARPDPLLSEQDRAAINRTAGLRLDTGGQHLATERFLLYAAVSRPTDLLVLSWRAADDDGQPAVRSLFVDDVLDRFSDAPLERVRRRPLGAPPEDLAPLAGLPPAPPAPLGPLARPVVDPDGPVSASAIEAWASCPVKWFVERLLHPEPLVADPEALLRGKVAHAVLGEVLEAAPLTPDTLDAARERMHAALARHLAAHPISVNPERLRGEARRLEAALVRYLEQEAHDASAFSPQQFEKDFEADLGPFRLRGRIDRIDVRDGRCVVVDYKGRTATPVARWIKDRKLQLGLYLLAARRLADVGEPVGGLYAPLGADDPRPRGALLRGADPGRRAVATDLLEREAFEAVLEEVLAEAERVVGELRAGRLEPRPRTCAWDGSGCSYPTICRCDG